MWQLFVSLIRVRLCGGCVRSSLLSQVELIIRDIMDKKLKKAKFDDQKCKVRGERSKSKRGQSSMIRACGQGAARGQRGRRRLTAAGALLLPGSGAGAGAVHGDQGEGQG